MVSPGEATNHFDQRSASHHRQVSDVHGKVSVAAHVSRHQWHLASDRRRAQRSCAALPGPLRCAARSICALCDARD
eukprot:1724179-Rhodomonas_salina.1